MMHDATHYRLTDQATDWIVRDSPRLDSDCMNEVSNNTVKKAVIPVAGLGTRFFPVTKRVPKAMLPVLSTPLIQHAVEDAVSAGVTDIAFVEDHNKVSPYFEFSSELDDLLRERGKDDLAKSIRDVCESAKFHSLIQPEPLGLGHAVLLARDFVGDDPFVVLLPDEVLWGQPSAVAQLIDTKTKFGGIVVGLMPTSWDDVHTKGIAAGRELSGGVIAIDTMVEKPPRENAPSNLAIVGRYVFDSDIFDRLQAVQPGAGGEIQLTDAMAACLGQLPVHGLVLDALRFDAGVPEGMFAATLHQGSKDPAMRQMIIDLAKELMADGRR